MVDAFIPAEEKGRIEEGDGVVDERKELGGAREVGTSSTDVTGSLDTTFPNDTSGLCNHVSTAIVEARKEKGTYQVILQMLSNTRKIVHNIHSNLVKDILRANTTMHKHLRTPQRSSRQNNLPIHTHQTSYSAHPSQTPHCVQ